MNKEHDVNREKQEDCFTLKVYPELRQNNCC